MSKAKTMKVLARRSKSKVRKELLRRANKLKKSSPGCNQRLKFKSSKRSRIAVLFKDCKGAHFYVSAKKDSFDNLDMALWSESAQIDLEIRYGRKVAKSIISDKMKLTEHYCWLLYDEAQSGGFNGLKAMIQEVGAYVCATIGKGNFLFDLTGPDPRFITMTDKLYDECHQIMQSETEAKESA